VSVDERSIMAAVALGSPEVGGGGAEEDVVVMMLLLIERGVGRPPLPLIILLGRLFDTATSWSWPASGRRAEGVVAFFFALLASNFAPFYHSSLLIIIGRS
jgi:hypothetical protein